MEAQFNLGVMAAHGQGLEQDFIAAYQVQSAFIGLPFSVTTEVMAVVDSCNAELT